MNIKIIYAALATLTAIAAYVPYVRDIRAKKTKPHAYTWLIWTLTLGTATAGLWYGGGGYAAYSMSVGTVLVFLMFLISFKYGTKNITRGDTFILFLALLAILMWWQVKNPALAVLLATAIDAGGYIPTLRKVLEEPWSESLPTWVLFTLSTLFGILALHAYNFLTLVYLLMSFTANMLLIGMCLVRRARIAKPA